MCFQKRDDYVYALSFQGMRVFEHLPRFADTWGRADIDAQHWLVANFQFGKQLFGQWFFQLHNHCQVMSIKSSIFDCAVTRAKQ